MNEIKKILVHVNASKEEFNATRRAVRLAKASHGTVKLVEVVSLQGAAGTAGADRKHRGADLGGPRLLAAGDQTGGVATRIKVEEEVEEVAPASGAALATMGG